MGEYNMPQQKGKPAPNSQDLTGKIFGKLTVTAKGNMKQFPCGTSARLWVCQCECGKITEVLANNLRRGNTKSCGCADTYRKRRKGELSHNWSGGRWINRDGYVMVYITESTKDYVRSSSRTYELEHVLVMSKFLNRKLTADETVHHINGIRDDNRLENLELWSSSHPPGQRVEDKIKWAEEILSLYKAQ
jgi:hypothetical protein